MRCFTVKDEGRNVKYIGFQRHIIDHEASGGFRMPLSTELVEWLIRELSINDAYDIVLLQHEPLSGIYTLRDGSESTTAVSQNEDITPILKAKANGGSGSFTDDDGVVHSYDFANAKAPILCSLHGHLHTEQWRIDTGVTSYCAVGECLHGLQGNTIGLIDRVNKKLRIWKFDNTAVYDELAIDICVEETTE